MKRTIHQITRATTLGVATLALTALGGSAADLVDTRQQEVQAAAKLLGITSLDSWQEPDRGLVYSEASVSKIAQKINSLGAASVFFPGPLELHPDHRVTALLVWAAIQQLSKESLSVNAYSYEIGVQNLVNVLIDITEQRPRKEQAMTIYASQNDENNYEDLTHFLD